MIKAGKQDGFTILELLIATLIFSVILLLCTFGLLQIGRMYNRGVINSASQETARNIIEDVSQTIQFGGGQVITSILPGGGGSTGFCIGNRRYSMRLGQMLSESPNAHGLVVDKLSVTCDATTQAQDLSSPSLTAGSREFLAPFDRVSNLAVTNLGNGLYKVTIRLAHGDDDLLNSPGGTNATCISQKGSQFCNVAELTTIVQKRIL